MSFKMKHYPSKNKYYKMCKMSYHHAVCHALCFKLCHMYNYIICCAVVQNYSALLML